MESKNKSKSELDASIHTDFSDQMSYDNYLHLNSLLSSQVPKSSPPHHDEMLFIIQHQVAELWMKLILHELTAALQYIRDDNLNPCFKILARVKHIQVQLFEQWVVLETLTPSEYAQFRHVLGHASGLQSAQYRAIEFLLGNKNAAFTKVFEHDKPCLTMLQDLLNSPSIYDEFLLYLHRKGYAIPEDCIRRDWSSAHIKNKDLVLVFKKIYDLPNEHWDAYAMCEKLVDVEEHFLLWRFRHMKTVERIIGFKKGTGGSSGVQYLKQALDLTFFPELFDVRTHIGNNSDA